LDRGTNLFDSCTRLDRLFAGNFGWKIVGRAMAFP
jgi:hypothetical protein